MPTKISKTEGRTKCLKCDVSGCNVLESFHASLRRRLTVAHPNIYAFVDHLRRVTVDNQADITRLDRDLRIRRPKTKRSLMNDACIKTCINRYDSRVYSPMQFLDAMSHTWAPTLQR